MAIEITGGRARSIVKLEEELGLLESDLSGLSNDEIETLFEIIGSSDKEDFEIFNNSLYSREMVDMETFLTDEYYLGHIGATLYPCWKDDLIELFEGNYNEAVISGAIGIGKNVFSTVAVARMVYEMSCIRDPQRLFGLEKGSEIAFCCISVNEQLAKHAVFGGIKTKIMSSRYFMENFPYKPTLSELRFPNNIWVAASSSSMSSALSLNTFGGILDEVNFMPDTPPRVRKIRYGAKQKERVSHAQTLYEMVLRRMKSRYLRQGRMPGILIMISSKSHTDAFTEKRIAAAYDDPSIFVRERSLWEVKRHLYSSETFSVFVGNERIRSMVIEDDEAHKTLSDMISSNIDYEDCQIIDVPVDFKRDFSTDLDSSLQDLAGVATVSISPFIQRREAVYECIDKTRSHPMDVIEWNPKDPAKINWKVLVKEYEEIDSQGRKSKITAPIVNPDALRHVHIDTSLNHDCTGICIAHIYDIVKVKRRDIDGEYHFEEAPLIYIDFMLRVIPPAGEDIILADVRSLLYSFLEHGYQFGLVTTDSYQSAEMRQYFEIQMGIETKMQSVDSKLDPYLEFRSAFYEHRVNMYHYQPFLTETQRLLHDKVHKKVDHPDDSESSKDVSDGVCGAIYTLTDVGSTLPIPIKRGISEFPDSEDPNEWVSETLERTGESPVKDISKGDDFLFPIIG